MEEEQKLIKLTKELFQKFISRDPVVFEQFFDFLHPEFTGFGTGNHEIWDDKEMAIKNEHQGYQDFPNPLTHKIHWIKATVFGNTGITRCVVDFEIPINNDLLVLNDLRYTYIWHHFENGWKNVHYHVSLPNMEQEEGEWISVDKLKARNKELERLVEQKTTELRNEKEKTEELLLNILPLETAQELKQNGAAQAKDYDMATVLFTDFKGFTMHSERLGAKELVAEIHHCFKAFDKIMVEHGVEKIKTVGDAYMAAAGLPTPNTTNPVDATKAALAIRDFMRDYQKQRVSEGREAFEIRIGVHSGPVVAGIVGIKKFAYDIWGDTVNVASRMESSSEVGKVNISQSTYELLKDYPEFKFHSRGRIKAKNKGELEMYFVERAS